LSTYAFLNISAHGHVNPTLPIVRELVGRGEKVIYLLPEEFQETVESVGAKFQAIPHLARLGKTEPSVTQAPNDEQLALIPFAMVYQAPQVVPQLVETLKAMKVDCLVYNTMNLWARLAGQILDVPVIGFRPFHAPRVHRSVVAPFATERLAGLAATADRELDQLARSFRHPSQTLQELVSKTEQLTLIFMPKEFQFEGDRFDDRFLFVGPSLIETPSERWPFETPATGRPPRVYISLGTLRNNEPGFYRSCFAAFNRREWQVVMSVGDRIDVASLVPFPDNFLVARSVRQTALLPNVDVFVTHGGLNSTMESLYFGVPLVVVPFIREQRLTARRVKELGLGIVLERETLTPGNLRDSVLTVAGDRELGRRVKAMQYLTRTAGGFRRATDAIQHHRIGFAQPP
jgi:MGT family glycosyltransferase